jgi:FtsH-binding integral membrane protein
MRLHSKRLHSKGWSDKEIRHAQAALERAEARKHPAYSFLEVAVFWGLLFLTVVGIFVVSVVIVPALLVLDTAMVAFILALLGLCLGSLFALLIQDIEWTERKHHVFNLVVLAAVAVVNIWVVVAKVNGLSEALALGNPHPPLLLGALFAIALLVPYLFHLLFERGGASG